MKPRKTETHLKRQCQSVNKSDSSIQTGVKGPRGVYFDRIKHRDACTAGYEKTNSFTGVSSSFQRTNSQSIWLQKLTTDAQRKKIADHAVREGRIIDIDYVPEYNLIASTYL